MRGLWMAVIAAALLAVPAARAQDGPKLDCVMTTISPELKEKMGVLIMSDLLMDRSRTEELRALYARFKLVTDPCAAKAGFDPQTYFTYAMWRISREWLIVELGKYSFDANIIDRVCDLGPGRPNSPPDGDLTDEQIEAIDDALVAAGVRPEELPDVVWVMVGAYRSVSADYWKTRAKLLV